MAPTKKPVESAATPSVSKRNGGEPKPEKCPECPKRKEEVFKWRKNKDDKYICNVCAQRAYRAKKREEARRAREEAEAQRPGPSEMRPEDGEMDEAEADEAERPEAEMAVVARNKLGRPRKRPINPPESDDEDQEARGSEKAKQPGRKRTRAVHRQEEEALRRERKLNRRKKFGPQRKPLAGDSSEESEYESDAAESKVVEDPEVGQEAEEVVAEVQDEDSDDEEVENGIVAPRKRSRGSDQTPTNLQAKRPKRRAAEVADPRAPSPLFENNHH